MILALVIVGGILILSGMIGGLFIGVTYADPPVAGVAGIIGAGLLGIALIIVGATLGGETSSVKPPTPEAKTGGMVGPKFNTIPGRVSITNIQPATSSPGVFISFTTDGNRCPMCNAVFTLTIGYSDGTSEVKEVITGVTSNHAYADFTPKSGKLPPGKVTISVSGFSTNPNVSGSMGPVSQPYTLTVNG